MKKVVAVMVVAGLSVGMTGCSGGDKVHTKSWWKQHPQEREQKIKECKNDDHMDMTDPNCGNAEGDFFGG